MSDPFLLALIFSLQIGIVVLLLIVLAAVAGIAERVRALQVRAASDDALVRAVGRITSPPWRESFDDSDKPWREVLERMKGAK